MIQSPPHDLRRVIGFAGGTALIVGITIGSGIFRTPPTIAGLVPNPLVIMGLWVAFGLISICGALAVAELSTMRSEEHTSELQSLRHLVCRLLLEKKKNTAVVRARPYISKANVLAEQHT